jgi:hypothetical protein
MKRQTQLLQVRLQEVCFQPTQLCSRFGCLIKRTLRLHEKGGANHFALLKKYFQFPIGKKKASSMRACLFQRGRKEISGLTIAVSCISILPLFRMIVFIH